MNTVTQPVTVIQRHGYESDHSSESGSAVQLYILYFHCM